MRHGKKINHLGRTSAHRHAMLSNMASSLILHKRIKTTVAKAKALQKYVEPLITKGKNDTTHSRRVVFSYLQNKESVTELFRDVSLKVANRPGGYTRILKLGHRLGDNAEMCYLELVDYNESYTTQVETKTKKTRRRAPKASAIVDAKTPVEASNKVEENEAVAEAKDQTPTPEASAEQTENKE